MRAGGRLPAAPSGALAAEEASREIAFAVTSSSPEQAGPNALPVPRRDHGLIEYRLPWRGDVASGEDRSSVRSGTAPRAPANPRDTLLDVARDAAEPLPELRETFAENRLEAIDAARKGGLRMTLM